MTILKGIPRILPPRLLYALASMGHGDMIVLGDANFPAASVAKANDAELIRCDSLTVPQLLEAICKLMPLDRHTPYPAAVMQVTPQDQGTIETPVWDEFRRILKQAEQRDDIVLEEVERMAFYERAKKAYVVVATGESALYGNLILYKGVLGPEEA
ncbi:Fucose mutarotase [Seminavis robusta]|uniref:L-fucose mutarotase n=1 Tax=Seminavis robusta TaxID=568900 RepID=A0A9N8E178_9STRA|nr:Fucose mutarotase [Seminavis robusta]|eukprot:Sro405_g136230.1 Fucose mutarotase (156) ;mRNA; r:55809-56276